MSTILKLSIEEYSRMIEHGAFDLLHRRIELIRGELREMSPAGPVHDDLITFLAQWSSSVLDTNRIQVRIQCGLELTKQESRPEPDVLWVAARRYLDRHPSASDVHLAIEVADSSLQFDLDGKAVLYAEAGIVEYWIVDANDNCIHLFRDPQRVSGRASFQIQQRFGLGMCISPACLPQALLDISSLFGKSSS
jgi:Uma2 family endonuclease